MPGKTYIPRTTLAAGSNRVNSNYANKLHHDPVVKKMLANINSLETARTSLIIANNNLIQQLVDSNLNASVNIVDASLNDLTILPNYTISGEYYN